MPRECGIWIASERVLFADLVAWGLSIRVINALDTHCQALYVKDLAGLTLDEIARIPSIDRMGIDTVGTALRSFLDGERPSLYIKAIKEPIPAQIFNAMQVIPSLL